MTELISLNKLNCYLGHRRILSDISCQFNSGEVILISGANGAGKSTFLRLIAGLIEPETGQVSLAKNLQCSYQGHDLGLYPEFTVAENLNLFLEAANQKNRYQQCLTDWQLSELADQRVSDLSRGQGFRVALACTFNCNANVLLLDEPTANLDQAFCSLISNQIINFMKQAGPRLILIASHQELSLAELALRRISLCQGTLKEIEPNNFNHRST
jgi:heme exporter protein A